MGYLRCASVALLVLLAGVLIFQPTSFTMHAGAAPTLLNLGSRESVHPQSPTLKQTNLPLYFEANQGQADPRVKFLSRGAGYTLFLTEGGATLSLRAPRANDTARPASHARPRAEQRHGFRELHAPTEPARYSTDSVQLNLVAANPSPDVTGDSPQAGRVNYFVGNDPSRWHAGITTYKGVRYANVYPGVDMVFHGSQQQLEYDFEVAPGADLSKIALQVNGARDLHLAPNGDAVISTPLGDIALHKPVTSQGEGASHREVASKFELRSDGSLGFHVGDYDRDQKLVVDPVITYSSYLGGSDVDGISSMVTNSDEYVFVTGSTDSTDFPTTPGAYETTSPSPQQAFVSEFSQDGSSLIFSTYLVAPSGAGIFPTGIDRDTAGQIYVVGAVDAADFPTTSNAYQTVFAAGNSNAFLSVFNSTGSSLLYSTYLGGGSDFARGVRVGNPGRVYLAGYTGSTKFPTTVGAFKRTQKSSQLSCFVSKFDTTLSGTASLLYSTLLGGKTDQDGDLCYGIARDSNGHAFVVGVTSSVDFPTTTGAYQTHFGGFSDAFITKLNQTGSALLYSTYLGGSDEDWANAVRVDGDGNAYVTGSTDGHFPTTAGAYRKHVIGEQDAFVTKINSAGSSLVYSTYLGGTGIQLGDAIFLDSSRNAYVTGITNSGDFPTVNPTQAHNHGNGLFNGFASTLNTTGSALLFSTYMGGTGTSLDGDTADAISVRNNNAYVAGQTCATNFPITQGAFQTTQAGVCDGFIMKISDVIP